MPLYTIHHSYPLSEGHRDDIAVRITQIHTTLFATPAAFVNVTFDEYTSTPHYIAGKKHTGTVNFITANVRTGPTRTQDLYESLCRQLDDAWLQVIGADARGQGGAKLGGIFVLGNIIAGFEQGLMIGEAGRDREWVRENLPKMEEIANGGNELIKNMLKELKGREEFRDIVGNAA